MSRTRLYLMLFGIVSVMLMSSVSIRRILLDKDHIDRSFGREGNRVIVGRTLGELLTLTNELQLRYSIGIYEPRHTDNFDQLVKLLRQPQEWKATLVRAQLALDTAEQHALSKVLRKIDVLIEAETNAIKSWTHSSAEPLSDESYHFTRSQRNDIDSKAIIIVSELNVLKRKLLDASEEATSSSLTRMEVGNVILIGLQVLLFLAGLIGLFILIGSPAWKNRYVI